MDSAPPKLRKDLSIRRQETPQGKSYIVKDPVTNKFFRFREVERFLSKQLDGETSPDVIRQRVEEKFGAKLMPETYANFVSILDKAGLLDNENSSLRKKSNKPEKRLQGSILYLRYRIINPEKILEYLIHRVRFFFTPTFVKISSAMIFLAILITFENWGSYVDDLPRLMTLEAIPIFIILGFIVISGHEFAHGLTCRHFGGRVREMGFMFMYFQPAFYCNVSDAWLFPEKSKRMWVGFAGMYFEFFAWAIAVMVWRITDTDTFINFAALMVMTGSGISTLANMSPLLKLDGYYLLSDYLDIPNLRRKAFRYVGDGLKSLVGLADRPSERVTPRERRIYLAYGLIGTLTSFSAMSIATFQVGAFLIEQGQALALSLFLGLIGTRFRMRLNRMFGKPTKYSDEFDDDLEFGNNGHTKNMRDGFRNDAPPIRSREETRPFRLRPSGSEDIAPSLAREERIPQTLMPLQIPPEQLSPKPAEAPPAPDQHRKSESRSSSSTSSREEKKEKSSRSSRKKRRRKMNPYVLGFLAAMALLLLFFGWMQLRVTGPFNILPIQYADVRGEVDGVVTEVRVKEGDYVRAGEIIARISDREPRAQVQTTQAAINRIQAELRMLEIGPSKVEIAVAQMAVKRAKERLRFDQTKVERSKLLFEKDILSQMEFENARELLNVSENDVLEAERRLDALVGGVRPEQISAARAQLDGLMAQLRNYEIDLQRVEIRSPVSGVVSTPARQLKELLYQRIGRGAAIARVSDPKKLTVEIAASEKDLADIRVGHVVAFKARAYPDSTFYGIVTATAQTAGAAPSAPASNDGAAAAGPSTAATTILVTSIIDNSSLLLKPGMTGHAKIYCGERRVISLIMRRIMQTIKVEFWSWW